MQIPSWYVDRQNPWYRPGVFLNPGQGNNAFSLNRKSDRNPLAVTPLQVGTLDDLRVSDQVSFQDFEGDQWLECEGLESALLCLDYPVPVYVFDNHNHVFYAWAEALKAGWFDWGAALVHMDEHFDDASAPHTEVDLNDLEDVWRYTNEVLQIATYIQPALELGMFSSCQNYVESPDFERRASASGEVVINLDLDVFHEDMKHITWQQKVAVLQQVLPQTKLITVATSPYFIDQEKAIELVKRVVEELF